MFVTYTQFEVVGDGDAFDRWFLECVAVMRTLQGNVAYEFLHDPCSPGRRVIVEVWSTLEDHVAHLTHPKHVEMIAFGSDRGMRSVFVHHWENAEGHIARGRARTEDRLEDPQERSEMYGLIDEMRRAAAPGPAVNEP